MRQKSDISERSQSRWVTVRPVRGHLTPKMNITFFIRNLMVNNFLFYNFFDKRSIFREHLEKLFWGHIWQLFRERRRPTQKINVTFLPQSRYRIFYYLVVFSKKNSIFWNGKKPFLWAQVSFKEKGASGDENEYNLFYGQWGFECFFI